MKKDCQKGYFLVETIICLAVVATIMTVLYASITTSYVRQYDNLTKYNTTKGLYSLLEVKKFFTKDINDLKFQLGDNDYVLVNDYIENDSTEDEINFFKDFCSDLEIDKIYFTEYDLTKIIDAKVLGPKIQKNLNLEKDKHTNSTCFYRYVVIYTDGSYATAGIDCGSSN